MRNHIILPAAALLGGAAGLGLRVWQWLHAYDAQMERFRHGALCTYALFGLLAVLAGFFLFCAWTAKSSKPIPATCSRPGYMALMTIGGFLFLAAGALGLLEGMDKLQLWRNGFGEVTVLSYPLALLLCGGLSLVSGVCVLAVGKYAYRPQEGKSASLPVVFPPFALLLWLFATHQAHATDPILMRYGVYLFAAVLLTMAHYDAAGFYHGQRHTRRFLFCAPMGIALSVMSLSDGLSLFQTAMAAACTVTAMGHLIALLAPEVPAPATPDDPNELNAEL